MAQGCVFVQKLKTVKQLIAEVDAWVSLYAFVKACEPVWVIATST